MFIVVHGVVQGVGYRRFVADKAAGRRVRGMVRNADNGSVEIIAIGDRGDIRRFLRDINISMEHGPSVMHVDTYEENNKRFPKTARDYVSFVVE